MFVLRDREGNFAADGYAGEYEGDAHIPQEGPFVLCKDVKSAGVEAADLDDTIPIAVFAFDNRTEATKTAKKLSGWLSMPGPYEVVEVEPILKTVIIGFKVKEKG